MGKQEILDALHREYAEYYRLGFHHSLADGDFSDVNSCFPEGLVELSTRSRGVNSIEDSIPDSWFPEDISFAKSQIVNQVLLYKSECWDEVRPAYLTKYAWGIWYLEEYSFHYYFAAWVFQYLERTIDGYDGIASYILTSFNVHLDSCDTSLKFAKKHYKTLGLVLEWMIANDKKCVKDAQTLLNLLNEIDGYR